MSRRYLRRIARLERAILPIQEVAAPPSVLRLRASPRGSPRGEASLVGARWAGCHGIVCIQGRCPLLWTHGQYLQFRTRTQGGGTSTGWRLLRKCARASASAHCTVPAAVSYSRSLSVSASVVPPRKSPHRVRLALSGSHPTILNFDTFTVQFPSKLGDPLPQQCNMAAWTSPLHFQVHVACRTGTKFRTGLRWVDEQKREWVIPKTEAEFGASAQSAGSSDIRPDKEKWERVSSRTRGCEQHRSESQQDQTTNAETSNNRTGASPSTRRRAAPASNVSRPSTGRSPCGTALHPRQVTSTATQTLDDGRSLHQWALHPEAVLVGAAKGAA